MAQTYLDNLTRAARKFPHTQKRSTHTGSVHPHRRKTNSCRHRHRQLNHVKQINKADRGRQRVGVGVGVGAAASERQIAGKRQPVK